MSEFKACPHCDSEINKKAVKCKYCKEWVAEGKEEVSTAEAQKDEKPKEIKSASKTGSILTLSFLIVVALVLLFTNPKALGMILTLIAISGFIVSIIKIIVQIVTKRPVPKFNILALPVLLVMFIVGITVYSAAADDVDRPVAEPETEPAELSLGGEYGDINGWEFKKITIPVGTNPPPPEDVGVIGTEPRDRDAIIEGHDLASFGERWNVAAVNIGQPGLKVSEFDVTYGKPGAEAEHYIEEYLIVYAMPGYELEYLGFTGVDWQITPDIVGDKITGAWAALIYATVPDMTDEELVNVIDKLGFFELSETELADADIKKEIDGYEYWFISNDRWGNFEISPVDPDN